MALTGILRSLILTIALAITRAAFAQDVISTPPHQWPSSGYPATDCESCDRGTQSCRSQSCQSGTHVCQAEFEVGRPHKFIDGAGWVLGVPRKLFLWDRRADNHQVSEDTQASIAQYLATEGLDSVKVRVNQYAPGDEWRRLAANKKVHAGWRYTVGALSTLSYTLLPGRLFGGDAYNPYTDSVYLYSDVPALALEQAAYAHDVHERERPGTYATLQSLPLIGLWHEIHNKQDIHEYLAKYGSPSEQAEAHRILNPQLGSEVGEQIGSVVPGAGLPVQLTGVVLGHALGRHRASQIPTEAATLHANNDEIPTADASGVMPVTWASERSLYEPVSLPPIEEAVSGSPSVLTGD